MNRCGTNDGLNDHNRNGTPVCEDCRLAGAIYARTLRRRVELGMPTKGNKVPPRWKRHRVLQDMAQVGPVLDAAFRAGA